MWLLLTVSLGVAGIALVPSGLSLAVVDAEMSWRCGSALHVALAVVWTPFFVSRSRKVQAHRSIVLRPFFAALAGVLATIARRLMRRSPSTGPADLLLEYPACCCGTPLDFTIRSVEDDRCPPIVPEIAEPDPEGAIDWTESGTLLRPHANRELLSHGEVLKGERPLSSEK